MRLGARNLIVPLVATVLATAAFGGVVLLQNRAEAYGRAQATLANAGTQFALANFTLLELGTPGVSVRTVSARVRAAETNVTGAIADLRRTYPVPTLAATAARVRAEFHTLNGIAQLLYDDPSLITSSPVSSLPDVSVNVQGNAAQAAMLRTTQQYSQRVVRAKTEALIGAAFAIALLLVAFLVFYTRWVRLLAATRRDARSDALTGLGNRRALVEALERELPAATTDRPLALTIYDLDGFKAYNDSFGHLAGDALLVRFAQRLRESVGTSGAAYRMGGDEFCCLVCLPPEQLTEHVETARRALSEAGDGFEIGASAGCVLLPREASSADEALALADQRMYQRKAGAGRNATRQTADVLIEVIAQRDVSPRDRTRDVAELAALASEALDLPEDEVKRVRLAAELHDVGKTAIPDTILNKPSGLSADEWAFIRDHTIIGERIVRAAPELAKVAELIRSSHERVDGHGYPDGLAGDAIPLGARIVATCDAFAAMVSPRPYRPAMTVGEALAELRRGRGRQFDARVVDAVCAIIEQRAERLAA